MKTKKRLSYVLFLFCLALIIGCSDDDKIPAPNPDPGKPKEGVWTEPEKLMANEEGVLYFSPPKTSPLYNYKKDIYVHLGVVAGGTWFYVPAEWDENLEKCKMKKEGDNLWSLSFTPSLKEWFGASIPIPKIGLVFRNEQGDTKGYEEDLFISVEDDAFTPGKVVNEKQPVNTKAGINRSEDGTSVTFVLYDKDKNDKSWDYAYVVGDFTNWELKASHQMKRDATTASWWFTETNLDPNKEYAFQYFLGKKDDFLFVADAYSEKILDPHNDKYITSYPGLMEYPKKANGIVSVFKGKSDSYNWSISEFKIADENNLMIYELLLRDFTTSGDIKGAIGKLDYLKKLGVNAIELMPVQEFDGNDSWGYNPCFFFAMDKAYGTKNDYKLFVDECHKRGMAVILDVVYNHATGSHPFAKLYWDVGQNKTTNDNPWFNVDAPHPYSVFHDFNHASPLVREFVKRNLQFLLNEFKFDGFRFDLTKGFTQKRSSEATAGNYDEDRIAVLKEYNQAVKAINPNACVILEHFCEDKEEIELVKEGMKVWRNYNNAYCEAAMGYEKDSSFTGFYSSDTSGMPFGGYVSYMESHDEERMAFKQQKWGNWDLKTNIGSGMTRLATNAAFCFTVPGPKMIWQFGEMGYDVSIDENGRTGKKPLHWEYLDVAERISLHTTYTKLLNFRQNYSSLFQEEASFNWKVDASDWDTGRIITLERNGEKLFVIGNFTEKEITVEKPFESTGDWYNVMDKSVKSAFDGKGSVVIPPHEFKAYVNFNMDKY